jgi:uncharacterized protein YxeA
MNKKIIIGIVIVVLIVIAFAFLAYKPKEIVSGPETVTSEEVSILDDQVPSITEEQLNAITTEDPTFISNAEDSIAADTSLFYYD